MNGLEFEEVSGIFSLWYYRWLQHLTKPGRLFGIKLRKLKNSATNCLQMFGSKTEHYIPEDDTPSLFPEEEEEAPIEKAPQKVSEHERRVRQPNALSEIPSDLPREERIIDVPEEKRQGMTLIGYEESERIAYRTGLYVIHFKRAKYADPSDALRGVVTAPALKVLSIWDSQRKQPVPNKKNTIF